MYVVVTWIHLRLTRTLPLVTHEEKRNTDAMIDPDDWITLVGDFQDHILALTESLPPSPSRIK